MSNSSMRLAKCNKGFSLVEILVTISILGLMIGLLLPVIQKVRSTATRIQSTNKLRQLSTALSNFAAIENGDIPSIKNPTYYGFSGDPECKRNRSMFYHLLPFLEVPIDVMQMREQYSYNPNWTRMPIFLSSTDPTVNMLDSMYAESIPLRYRQDSPSSFSANMTAFEGLPNLNASFTDGLSSTIAYVERYCMAPLEFSNQVSHLYYYQYDRTQGPDPSVNYGTRRATFADRGWNDVVPVTTGDPPISRASRPGATFQVRPSVWEADYHLPASPYNGLLVVMFDGSVKLISPGVAETVFWAAVTRAAGEVNSNDW